jgi:DNA polymerase III subunit beta
MEFTIQKADFLNGLYLASGIADRKSTMPILANVLLRTDGKERIVCAATDLNVAVTAEVPARVRKEGGLTLAARHLHDIVKGFPGDEATLTRVENNWCVIRSGKIQYRIVGLPDRDFPRLPDHREVSFASFGASVLGEMIGRTFFAIATDESRYHLSGALFECDGKTARMVATDGHRLSKVERSVTGGPILPQGVLIPRKGLGEIRKALETLGGEDDSVEIGFHAGNVFVRVGDLVLSVKLVDAQFPPYEMVIPKDADKSVTLPRAALLESLRRVSLLAADRVKAIRLSLEKGTLRIASDNPDLGEATEELDVDYSGPPLAIGFNATYITDFLGELDDDEVKLEFSGELDPGVVRSVKAAGDIGVIMPMRI